MKVAVDNDKSLGYETHGSLRKLLNLFFVPLLNHLPKSFGQIIKHTNPKAGAVVEHATTHKALELLYKKGEPEHISGFMHKLFHNIWFHLGNTKAVRNRLRLVERELTKAVEEISLNRPTVSILSIASGSARAVIESVCEPKFKSLDISAIFLDKNPRAIEYSKELASICPSSCKIKWVEDTASNFPKYLNGSKVDVVEMVGLLDYFTDDSVLKIFNTIYKNLSNDGMMITANISDNSERKFVHDVIGWEMIYRNASDLIRLASEAGFDPSKMKAVYEPLKIHCVLIAKR